MIMTKFLVATVLAAMAMCTQAETFPWMNDFVACIARVPIYPAQPKLLETGTYKVMSDKTAFMPGEMLTFHIDGRPPTDTYRGLFITVLENGKAVGKWMPTEDFMPRACNGRKGSAMTEMSKEMKSMNEGLRWKAPECRYDMSYELIATVIRDENEFERNIKVDLKCMNGMPEPTPEASSVPESKPEGDTDEWEDGMEYDWFETTPEPAPEQNMGLGLPMNPLFGAAPEQTDVEPRELFIVNPTPEGESPAMNNLFMEPPTPEGETHQWDDGEEYEEGHKNMNHGNPEPEKKPMGGPINPLFMGAPNTEPEPPTPEGESHKWDDGKEYEEGDKYMMKGTPEPEKKPMGEPPMGGPMNPLFMGVPKTEPEPPTPEGESHKWDDGKEYEEGDKYMMKGTPEPEKKPMGEPPMGGPINPLFMGAPNTEPEPPTPEGESHKWDDGKEYEESAKDMMKGPPEPEKKPMGEPEKKPMGEPPMGYPTTEPEPDIPEGESHTWDDGKEYKEGAKDMMKGTPEPEKKPMGEPPMGYPSTEPEPAIPEGESHKWDDGKEYKEGAKDMMKGTPEPEKKPMGEPPMGYPSTEPEPAIPEGESHKWDDGKAYEESAKDMMKGTPEPEKKPMGEPEKKPMGEPPIGGLFNSLLMGAPLNPLFMGAPTSEPEPTPEGGSERWGDEEEYKENKMKPHPEQTSLVGSRKLEIPGTVPEGEKQKMKPEPELPSMKMPMNPLFIGAPTAEPEPQGNNWQNNEGGAHDNNIQYQEIEQPSKDQMPSFNHLFLGAPTTEPEPKPQGESDNWEAGDDYTKPEPPTPEGMKDGDHMGGKPEPPTPEGMKDGDHMGGKPEPPTPEGMKDGDHMGGKPEPPTPEGMKDGDHMGSKPEPPTPEGMKDGDHMGGKPEPPTPEGMKDGDHMGGKPEPTPEGMEGSDQTDKYMGKGMDSKPEPASPEGTTDGDYMGSVAEGASDVVGSRKLKLPETPQPEGMGGHEYGGDDAKKPEPVPEGRPRNPKPLGLHAMRKCKNPKYDVPLGASTSFENGNMGAWRNDTKGKLMWLPRMGKTPSPNTGPDGAYDGGHYIYMESSRPARMGDSAILRSPSGLRGCLCVRFMCHMMVDPYTTIELIINNKMMQSNGFSHLGWQMMYQTVDVPGEIMVEIKATAGSTFRGDVAVDDITVTPGMCVEDMI